MRLSRTKLEVCNSGHHVGRQLVCRKRQRRVLVEVVKTSGHALRHVGPSEAGHDEEGFLLAVVETERKTHRFVLSRVIFTFVPSLSWQKTYRF